MVLRNPKIFETTFETYTATEIIGEGLASHIYKATDEAGETWAIKLFDSSRVSRDKRKRFENEIRFCSRNTHSRVVKPAVWLRFVIKPRD